MKLRGGWHFHDEPKSSGAELGFQASAWYEDRVMDGPTSEGKGSKGSSWLDCIRGKGIMPPDA